MKKPARYTNSNLLLLLLLLLLENYQQQKDLLNVMCRGKT